MGLHQIIFTSCKRGINGVNDGQQIFSYDASFRDANSDDIKRLFSYTIPSLPAGESMTEELAKTMPKAFSYRKLRDGRSAVVLNTYLGRDYMGSEGRFGNYLGHAVIADEGQLDCYPCELYGGAFLRDHMEYEEVNNPNPPDYLPTPVLVPGDQITVDAVVDFLSAENRMEIFKNMVYTLLTYEATKRRIIICDAPENIIFWIAAMEYTLPLKLALEINFTTYEYSPALSASQICGVVREGTDFDRNGNYYIFDLETNHCPEFTKDRGFFRFLQTTMSFSYDSLKHFHKFLTRGYSYNRADTDMIAAYHLYTILYDGAAGATLEELQAAFDFAEKYAMPKERHHIFESLLNQKESLLAAETPQFFLLLQFLLSSQKAYDVEAQDTIRDLLIDRIFAELEKEDSHSFADFYQQADSFCAKNGIALASELMQKADRIFDIVQEDGIPWKAVFFLQIAGTSLKNRKNLINDRFMTTPLGCMYHDIIRSVYLKDTREGFGLVCKILDGFAEESSTLTQMALAIETVLRDLPKGNEKTLTLWQYYNQIMLKGGTEKLTDAWDILNKAHREELIYSLYSAAMSKTTVFANLQKIFEDHYSTIVVKNKNYARQYENKILCDYYDRLAAYNDDEIYMTERELFYIISTRKVRVPFVYKLIDKIVRKIPLDCPTKDNKAIIEAMFNYQYNFLHEQLGEKLMLLVIADSIEQCQSRDQLLSMLDKLEILTRDNCADLSRVTVRGAEHYCNWLLPHPCVLVMEKSDFERLYNLFIMPAETANLFFSTMAEKVYNRCTAAGNFEVFCEYLAFALPKGNPRTMECIGKALPKLTGHRFVWLDQMVSNAFHNDYQMMQNWNMIKKASGSAKNAFAEFFRHKKDN